MLKELGQGSKKNSVSVSTCEVFLTLFLNFYGLDPNTYYFPLSDFASQSRLAPKYKECFLLCS